MLIVSIGDSVASGEGNPDVPRAIHPGWLDSRCHRSMRSGAAQAALAVAAGDPHSSVTFFPLACSGATVLKGLLGPFEGIQPDRRGDLPAQVRQLAALSPRRTIDAVLLSVGANDVYFAPLTRFCFWVPSCPHRRFDPDHPDREAPDRRTGSADDVHADAQRALPRRYASLARELKKAGVASERVIIVEYFDPTHDEGGDTCKRLLPRISPTETEWAQETVLGPLNREVRNAAQRYRWQLVGGVQQAFTSHGVCAHGPQRWVRRVDESLRRGSALSGPLHPNSAGHLATAALISPVLAKVVAVDPGAAVAQAAGAGDDEGGDVAWWWLLVAVAGGSLLTLAVQLLVRLRRSRTS